MGGRRPCGEQTVFFTFDDDFTNIVSSQVFNDFSNLVNVQVFNFTNLVATVCLNCTRAEAPVIILYNSLYASVS